MLVRRAFSCGSHIDDSQRRIWLSLVSAMVFAMLAVVRKHKVVDAVIRSVMVNVMHNLMAMQFAPKVLLHDVTMLKNTLAVMGDIAVAIRAKTSCAIRIFDGAKSSVSLLPKVMSGA